MNIKNNNATCSNQHVQNEFKTFLQRKPLHTRMDEQEFRAWDSGYTLLNFSRANQSENLGNSQIRKRGGLAW
jgi:hypothetical protein